jgi:hypothetical protein
MEEAGQNLGSSGLRLFRRIVFPLAMPGYIAGRSLVFIKVFDDLGTPLLLNVKDMLAPQAYLRITSVGISDPMGYVISVVLIAFSILSTSGPRWSCAARIMPRSSAAAAVWPSATCRRASRSSPMASVLFILALVLSPHIGLAAAVLQHGLVALPPCRTAIPGRTMSACGEARSSTSPTRCSMPGWPALGDVMMGTAPSPISCCAPACRGPQMAGLHGQRRAGGAGRGAGHRLSARLYGVRCLPDGKPLRDSVGDHLAIAHDPPPALCAARLHGGAAADQRVAGGSCGESRAPPRRAPSAALLCH